MYSAIKAEVPVEEDPSTHLNTVFLEQVLAYKELVVCGEAKSHCVNSTVRDLMENNPNKTPIVVFSDGCSNVPGFEHAGDQFEKDAKEKGVTFTTIAEWVGNQ
jgi:nicotinamidase-related amidase